MARMREDLTFINDRDAVGSGLATSPVGVAWIRDIQQSVYVDAPADTAEAQAKADQADTRAGNAQDSADAAQTSANGAQAAAEAAQSRADDAYDLAGTKVTQNVGPSFAAPAAAASRIALPAYTGGTAAATYTQADMQALIDQVAALTSRVAALITDGRANKSLTN